MGGHRVEHNAGAVKCDHGITESGGVPIPRWTTHPCSPRKPWARFRLRYNLGFEEYRKQVPGTVERYS